MFNVNYKTVSMGLITVLIGSQAFAQAVRPRERVREEVRAKEAIQQAPSTKAGDAIVDGFKNAPAGRAAVQAPVTFQNEKGNSCNAETYASKLVEGTSVSYADGLALVQGQFIKMGVCGVEEGALLGYSADARETLVLAALHVSKTFGGRTLRQLTSQEVASADQVWADGLAKAKDRNGGTKYTAATEIVTAQKIKNDCQLRN